MPIFVITGPDTSAVSSRVSSIVAENIDNGQVERFDISESAEREKMIVAAQTRSLFGGNRILLGYPAAETTEEMGRELAGLDHPGLFVVLHGEGALKVGVHRALPDATVERFLLPNDRDRVGRVRALVQEAGLRVDGQVVQMLAHIAPTHWPLVLQIVEHFRSEGFISPTVADVQPFIGTARGQIFPWVLFDAIVSGDRMFVLEAVDVVEPFPMLGYLTAQITRLGKVLELGDCPVEEVSSILDISRDATQKLVNLGKKVGPKGVQRANQLLTDAGRELKVASVPRDVLRVLVIRLAEILA